MLASPENCVLAALGTQEALCQLLNSRRKFPSYCRWMAVRRAGGKWGEQRREREMQRYGVPLHQTFCKIKVNHSVVSTGRGKNN